jgi:hypothetical protein
VKRNGPLRFGGDLVQRGTRRRINHGHDAASDGVFEVLLVEGAEEEDGLANASVTQGDGFVELYNGEAEDFWLRFEELGDIRDTHAVAVVFDDREIGTRGGAAGDFLDVVAKIITVNLDPGIEGGIFGNEGVRSVLGKEGRRRSKKCGKGEAGFEKGSPRWFHGVTTS